MEGIPTSRETARNIALEKGFERRQEASRRISGFFGSIKEKIIKGVDFALGSPEAAIYLGIKAAELGKEKAAEVIDSAVEAGIGVLEGAMDTKDRLVQRGVDSRDRLVARYEQTRDATNAKVADLSRKAAVWGLTNVAGPIEVRLRQIHNIPANIKEWQAGEEIIKAQEHEAKARLMREEGEARISALYEEIRRIQAETEENMQIIRSLQDAALTRAGELITNAAGKRNQSMRIFGKIRKIIEGLQVPATSSLR